jgi:hypothetical protein
MPTNAVTRRPRSAQLKAIMQAAPTFEAVAIGRDKRLSTRRRRLHGAMAVGLPVAAMLAIAAPATADGWELVPTPNAPGWAQSALHAVSCPPRITSCVAAGGAATADFSAEQGISEAWNGAGWSVAFGAGVAATTHFASVSCVSSSACEAVGYYFPSGGELGALAEGWNGSSWTFQAVNPPSGAHGIFLNGVSCPSASQCFAVGSYADSGGVERPLFESWDGTSWQQQPAFEGRNIGLNAVSCPATNACLAVGFSNSLFPVAERWNGIAWDSESPAPPAGIDGDLTGVSCLSSVYCVAVGDYHAAAGQQLTFAELSLGSNQWSLLNTINASATSNVLDGVSCTRGGLFGGTGPKCQAVGFQEQGPTQFAQAQVWNGLNWSYEVPAGTAMGTSDFLLGDSCVSALSCTAVGYFTGLGVGAGPPPEQTLVEQLTPGPGPHALSLTRRGHVLALLRKPRNLELLVFRLGRHGRLLGAVGLGHHPKGRSLIRWNMRVTGRRLAAGTYTAELVAALGRGAASDGPSVTFKLTYPTGPIRVQSSTCSVSKASSNRC